MTNQMTINSNIIATFLFLTLFVIGLFNSIGLLFFLLIALLYGIKNSKNSIRAINIVTFRSVLNPGLAISISQFELLKWMVLFGCAGKLVFDYFKIHDRKKLNNILLPVLLYLIYSSLSSFFFSNLPVVALMKILSYGFIFMGILIGIYNTIETFDWISWIYKMLLSIVVLSIPLIPLDVGYLRNRTAFQGIINHPNLFGVIMVLFIAVNIVMLQLNKHKLNITGHFLNILSLLLIWLTNSRTSLISAFILIVIYLFLSRGYL